ncbi:unnamed protein product [Cylicocyclus nassatus]|uniref:Long-chain-fatty-acid--CoA ligase n=1 Tax=Cylicocyclus nassatus TaxID=53992 RepID=A0AA36M6Q9_CYLNA|nr:unnamed protein product [Cylicocyclus nassatus]
MDFDWGYVFIIALWAFFPGAIALAGSIFFLFLRSRQKKAITEAPPRPNVNWDKQSLPVKGEPGVYKCGLLTNDNENVVERIYPEVVTLYDAFLYGMKKSNDADCLGKRGPDGKFYFRKYSAILKDSEYFASALFGELDLRPGDKIGIYSQNRPEWIITALGCMQQSVILVPLYDTLGADAASFIVSQTEISVVLVDSVARAKNLLSKKDSMPSFRTIIMAEKKEITDELTKETQLHGIRLMSYEDVLHAGIKNPKPKHLPNKDNIYIICYTSGTTGRPKGVILTHKNVMANVSSFVYMATTLDPGLLDEDILVLSYLPLSHMMEQVCHWVLLMHGFRIAYYSGSIPRLTEDIAACVPTALMVVPRILNRLYAAIQAKVEGSIFSRAIYSIAYSQKFELMKQGIFTKDTIWDKFVFNKVQKQLGGKIGFMMAGSAPLSEQVLQTCRIALGAKIAEAYGQTETTAIATLSWLGDWTGGHCGGVSTCCNIKLIDVPELNYYAKDGRGEIMIRGPSVTQGYYKDPEKTKELFAEDGFIHSGDIGELQPNGTIKIIDRAKHIFKLAQGEYVAPEKIENIYIRSPVVQQVFVDGNSLERYLIGVVVPQPEVMEEWNKENGVEGRTLQEIYEDKKAQEYVLSKLQEIGKENKLNSIEQVKRVYLEMDPFTVENNLLTPTLKAKRPQLRQKYKDIMNKIYEQNRNS